MAKRRMQFRCGPCRATAPAWVGQCPSCGEWNTLVEEAVGDERRPARRSVARPAEPIGQVSSDRVAPHPTGQAELDRVLGGGLVPGSVTLIGGEPGIGKSTLLLQAALSLARGGRRVLYVTAEESAAQVRARGERLGSLEAAGDRLLLAAELDVTAVAAHIDATAPDVVIVDSVQMVHDPELPSAPGSVVQVRACAGMLAAEARRTGTAVFLVGHVTKDGGIAGPRVLEHLVDTVLSFDGDRHHALRLLRALKHRFGATGELGVMEMTGAGLAPVADPSGLFLADRLAGAEGSVVVPVMEGSRPLVVEVQALVASTSLPTPRRAANGVDNGRLGLVVAVLQKRLGRSFAAKDVWVTVAGGLRVPGPGADLAMALAIVSADVGRPIPADVVACGEVGLTGEIRQVAHTERRLAEAARLGFGRAIVPPGSPLVEGLETTTVATLGDALAAMLLDPALDDPPAETEPALRAVPS